MPEVQFAQPVPWQIGYSIAFVAGVGYGWHVAIDGHDYLIDLESGDFKYQTVPLLRAQSDDSAQPGEASVNPEDAWRRGASSWHLGAGQPNADRDPTGRDLSPSRFRESQGIDIWTDDQISLLPDTDEKRSSANSNLKMVVAGSRVYVTDGQDVAFATDLTGDTPTFTNCTGEPAASILDIASDGYHVWITDGSNIYQSNTGTGAFSSWSTQDADVLAYVKGRLMAGHDNTLYYCSNLATPTFTSLLAHDNTEWDWVAFAEGKNAIYAAGTSGDKSLIYRVGIKTDGSGLDVPLVAAELPDGETVTGMGGYLGLVFIGTTKGVRYAEPDDDGNLTLGAPFGPANAKCFEGQDRYVWFGWTSYDGAYSGLGRCTPRRFAEVDERVPVYATDLMVAGTAAVTTVCTFGGKRYFAIAGDGFYGEDTDLVASGTIDSGFYGWGLADEKIALTLDVRFQDFAGEVVAYLATDGGSFTQIGSSTAGDSATYPCNERRGERHEVRFTLMRDDGDAATGPTITRWSLRAQPAPGAGVGSGLARMHYVPLVFKPRLTLEGGRQVNFDVRTELNHLFDLNSTRQVVSFQRGTHQHSVIVDDIQFTQTYLRDGVFGGTCLVALKEQ